MKKLYVYVLRKNKKILLITKEKTHIYGRLFFSVKCLDSVDLNIDIDFKNSPIRFWNHTYTNTINTGSEITKLEYEQNCLDITRIILIDLFIGNLLVLVADIHKTILINFFSINCFKYKTYSAFELFYKIKFFLKIMMLVLKIKKIKKFELKKLALINFLNCYELPYYKLWYFNFLKAAVC